MAGLGHGGPSA